MFIFKLKILLLIIIICRSISIYAQQRLADVIRVQLFPLSCQSSFEEIDAILSDYSQYRLQLAVWSGIWNSVECCYTAFVLFDPHTIIGEDLIPILNQDNRVWNVSYVANTRSRQLQILLDEDTNLDKFLNSYQEFGLKTGHLYERPWVNPPHTPQYLFM